MPGKNIDTRTGVNVETGNRRPDVDTGWQRPVFSPAVRPRDAFTMPLRSIAVPVVEAQPKVEQPAPPPKPKPKPEPPAPVFEPREAEVKTTKRPADMSWAADKLPARAVTQPAELAPSVQEGKAAPVATSGMVPTLEPGETVNTQTGEVFAPVVGMTDAQLDAHLLKAYDESSKEDDRLYNQTPIDRVLAARERKGDAKASIVEPATLVEPVAVVEPAVVIEPAKVSKVTQAEQQNLFDDIVTIGTEESIKQGFGLVDRMLSAGLDPGLMRGRTGRMLESYPDNPTMLMLRGFSELIAGGDVSMAAHDLMGAVVSAQDRYLPKGSTTYVRQLVNLINNRLNKGNYVDAQKMFSELLVVGSDGIFKTKDLTKWSKPETKKAPAKATQPAAAPASQPTQPAAKIPATLESAPAAPAGPSEPVDSGPPPAGGGDANIDPREADQRILIEALTRLGFDYSRRGIGLDKLGEPQYNEQLTAGERAAYNRYAKEKAKAEKKRKADEAANPPRSRIQQAIDFAVELNRTTLDKRAARFDLKANKEGVGGDTKTKRGTIIHSDAVLKEMRETFAWFGRKYTKADEWVLFAAVRIYRGLGVSRSGKIFGAANEELEITDDEFIKALREMRENADSHNHPFAWNNQGYVMGGRVRYPVIATREIAEFFTQNQNANENHILSNTQDFIDYNVDQFTRADGVNNAMKQIAEFDQQESVYDLVEAAHPGLNLRPVNSRTSSYERLSTSSEFAQVANDKNLLAENARDLAEYENRARSATNKTRRRGSLDYHAMTGKEFVDAVKKKDWTSIFRNLPDRSGRFFDGVLRAMATLQVGLVPALMVTSPIEKVMGVQGQEWGMDNLRRGLPTDEVMPTKASMERVTEAPTVNAIHELIKLLNSHGPYAVVDAAARGVVFSAQGLHQAREGAGGAIKGVVDLGFDLAMDITTADWMKKKETAQVFLEHLVYQIYISQTRHGGVKLTPQDIEADLNGDPEGFLQTWAATPEGMQAIAYASRSSLGGADVATEGLRQILANRVRHAGVAALVGLFPKFGIRAPQSMFWMSQSTMYIGKKLTDLFNTKVRGVDEKQVADSNNIMLGGNEEFFFGLQQNFMVDCAMMGVRAPIYLLSLAIVGILAGLSGGIEEPDDPKKRHLWFEWQINGVAFKTNWFFQETLAFAMPTAVGVLAAQKTGDIGLGVQIIHFGILEAMADNPWLNPFDAIDFIANFDQTLQTEKLKAEGYSENEEVSTLDFLSTQAYVWFLRKVVGGFDSGAWKSLWGDHGIFKGDQDLARSRHQINTGNPDDPTKQTSYADAQIRGVTMKSPAAAAWQNAISRITDDAVNGYDRERMPLTTTSDPVQMMHWRQFTVFDQDTGAPIMDIGKWPADKKQEIINAVILHTEGKTPTDILKQGVVIPFWARAATVEYLYGLKAIPAKDFKDRDIAGEWTVDFSKHSYAENTRLLAQARKDKQIAKDAMYAAQADIDKKIDVMFDDTVPYGAQKYNMKEQSWESVYTWKTDGPYWGTPAGGPATAGDYLLFPDKVDFKLYPYGNERSSILPIATVDNPNNTYDAQTKLSWQRGPGGAPGTDPALDRFGFPFVDRKYTDPGTDNAAVLADLGGYVIETGRNKGTLLSDLITGNGAIGIEDTGMVWDELKFVLGQRGWIPVEEKFEKLNRADYKVLADAAKLGTYETPAAKSDGTRFYGGYGGGGGGGYANRLYSHPAYSLNADKPAGIYSKFPSYTRFDYLRPKVLTKGSREAYRREDF